MNLLFQFQDVVHEKRHHPRKQAWIKIQDFGLLNRLKARKESQTLKLPMIDLRKPEI